MIKVKISFPDGEEVELSLKNLLDLFNVRQSQYYTLSQYDSWLDQVKKYSIDSQITREYKCVKYKGGHE